MWELGRPVWVVAVEIRGNIGDLKGVFVFLFERIVSTVFCLCHEGYSWNRDSRSVSQEENVEISRYLEKYLRPSTKNDPLQKKSLMFCEIFLA